LRIKTPAVVGLRLDPFQPLLLGFRVKKGNRTTNGKRTSREITVEQEQSDKNVEEIELLEQQEQTSAETPAAETEMYPISMTVWKKDPQVTTASRLSKSAKKRL